MIDNLTPWTAGYEGRVCPPAPADEAEAHFWHRAYRTGQADRVAEGQALVCPEDGTLLQKSAEGWDCKFHPNEQKGQVMAM